MYGKTPLRAERTILTSVVLAIVVACLLLFCRSRTVHVESVTRHTAPNGDVVFAVSIVNPTDDGVDATVHLSTGHQTNGGARSGSVATHKRSCYVPASETVVLKVAFPAEHALFIGESHSASIGGIKVRAN